ncbi:MAG: DMT family transporter [Gammaproteobacteria bacterium]|nr:DMT family transporter [Gammaproteobacteria bacterium]
MAGDTVTASSVPRERIGLGISLAALAYALFAVHDASNKWLVRTIPVWQILFFRSAVVTIGSLAVGGRRVVVRVLTTPLRLALAGRAIITLIAWLAYYTAAGTLPLAQLLTLYFSAPLMTALLAVPLLGEPVHGARWTSVLLGFCGVLVAADPGRMHTSRATFLVLAAAATWGYSTILMRRIARLESSLVQMLAQNVFFLLITGAMSAFTWVRPDRRQCALLLLVGVLGGGGQFLLYEAVRFAPAVIVATVEYSALIWAFILGYLVFGDIPHTNVWAGAALILASGIYMLWRERRRLFRED